MAEPIDPSLADAGLAACLVEAVRKDPGPPARAVGAAGNRAARAGTTSCGSGPAPSAVTRAASTVPAAATNAVTTRICRPEEITLADCGRKR